MYGTIPYLNIDIFISFKAIILKGHDGLHASRMKHNNNDYEERRVQWTNNIRHHVQYKSMNHQ